MRALDLDSGNNVPLNLTSLALKKPYRNSVRAGKGRRGFLRVLSPTPIFSFLKERTQTLKYQRDQDSEEVGREYGLFLDKEYLHTFILFIIIGAVRKDPKITVEIESRHNINAPAFISSIHLLYCVHVCVCMCVFSAFPPLYCERF